MLAMSSAIQLDCVTFKRVRTTTLAWSPEQVVGKFWTITIRGI